MPCYNLKRPKALFSLTLIVCQLVLVSSFLFAANARAESTSAEIVDTPAPVEILAPETPVEAPASDTSLGEPVADEATTTPDIPEEATSTLIITPEEPAAPAETSHDVVTGIIRDLSINNLTIISQWQMSAQKQDDAYLGTDDSTDKGAQVLPSGQYQVAKPVVACALVADPNGLDKVNVNAVVNYPQDAGLMIDDLGAKLGCGQVKTVTALKQLDFEAASKLLCDQIRNNNNNLLNWQTNAEQNITYSYDQVCGNEGYLAKKTATVFCAETALAYNDPAGDYQTQVTAQNESGLATTAINNFKYLELTTFENDFTNIQYGPTRLNELKILNGDLVWGNAAPTIRNTGNTRLKLQIRQNDFGFGKNGNVWNIGYSARIGSQKEFTFYWPEQTITLDNAINLGEVVNLDFGALVTSFPLINAESAFAGNMTLSAEKAEALSCQ